MKVAIIAGSPHPHAVSTAMAGRLAASLASQGDTAELFELRRLEYRGCVACMACKNGQDACALRDGLTPVLAAIAASDAVVLAAGVYWADLPSGLKALVDRCYAFYRPRFWEKAVQTRFATRKPLGFLLPQGNGDPALYADIAGRYGAVMRDVGFDHEPSLAVRAVGLTETAGLDGRPDLLAALDALAPALRRAVAAPSPVDP